MTEKLKENLKPLTFKNNYRILKKWHKLLNAYTLSDPLVICDQVKKLNKDLYCEINVHFHLSNHSIHA